MEEGRYHYHHHHGHDTSSTNEGRGSQQELNSQSQTNEQQQQQQQRYVNQPGPAPIIVPRLNEQPNSSGVQATGSFHSVSSIDSSAEMARYFPDPQTPTLAPLRYNPLSGSQQLQTTATSSTLNNNTGPYAPLPVPTVAQPPVRQQQIRAPVHMPQQRSTQGPAAPQLPPGIPSYSSQIEGLSVSQAIVNDVIVDLQSKVINETQQQYNNESANGSFLETLSPIYIRAPNPTIILRSDLHRLRAQLAARPPTVVRPAGGMNQLQQNTFQVPSFPPPPQQHIPPGNYHRKKNNYIF
ncbi:unnamed protein product [Adineta steineri]|uniref:Uncharacterized protein n=1 Tax=Adineta steineri TaxID=433720 RepID=A0A814VCL6_9BILA|nr:unnamed protein product [Adineta steineri]